MDTPARKPDRTLWVVIGVVAALVVVALIVVFTRGGSAPLDESSPAGVVQRYTQAVLDRDREAALRHLAPDVADRCERLDPSAADDVRAVLDDTREHGDSAEVTVTISQPAGGGLLGPNEYSYQASFWLARTDSGWVIETAPWEFAVCAEVTQ
ncbi:hypothetical protein ACQ143_09265 [Microbacterium sp. MC2]